MNAGNVSCYVWVSTIDPPTWEHCLLINTHIHIQATHICIFSKSCMDREWLIVSNTTYTQEHISSSIVVVDSTIHFGAQSFQRPLALVGPAAAATVVSWPCTYFRRLLFWNAKFQSLCYVKHSYCVKLLMGWVELSLEILDDI